jgi:predicted Ser/Thr protein kinase
MFSEKNKIHSSPYDSARSVHYINNNIYKVLDSNKSLSNSQRYNSLKKESEILVHLSEIAGTPKNVEYGSQENFEYIKYDYIKAKPINKLANNAENSMRNIEFLIIRLLLAISFKGVAHRDIKPEKILIDEERKVYLIDFDQAAMTSIVSALRQNIFGTIGAKPAVHGSWYTLRKKIKKRRKTHIKRIKMSLNNTIKRYLPYRALSYYRIAKSNFGKRKKNRVVMPPTLHDDCSQELQYFRRAWLLAMNSSASSPNEAIAYYSINFQGYHFPGERPWLERWKYLSIATDYKGKKILELGCNLSLLSCYLLAESNALEVLSVDTDAEILAAAQLISAAYGVSPYYCRVNFDSTQQWEQRLSIFQPDIVFCLNVLNWVINKDRFKKFLFNFNEIVFEGHDDYQVEKRMFSDNGYDAKIVSTSERGRTVWHAKKRSMR